jgi:hypothetical protein
MRGAAQVLPWALRCVAFRPPGVRARRHAKLALRLPVPPLSLGLVPLVGAPLPTRDGQVLRGAEGVNVRGDDLAEGGGVEVKYVRCCGGGRKGCGGRACDVAHPLHQRVPRVQGADHGRDEGRDAPQKLRLAASPWAAAHYRSHARQKVDHSRDEGRDAPQELRTAASPQGGRVLPLPRPEEGGASATTARPRIGEPPPGTL